MKRLVFGSVVSAGLKIASAGLSFLMFMYLARVLGAEEYGHFAAMFALGTIGGVASLFGQHTLSIKSLSAQIDQADQGAQRRRTIVSSFVIVLGFATGFVLLLMVGGLVGRSLGWTIDPRYLIGAAVLVLPFALAELVSHQFRAFGSIIFALAPRDILWRAAIVLGCLGIAAWPFLFTDALQAMRVVSASLMLLVLIQLGAMLLRHRRLLSAKTESGRGEAVKWRVSAWMWLASLGTMGASLNIIAATPFLPADQVGAYFAAQKTSQLLQLPIIAINIAATPAFARLHSQNDVEQLRRVLRRLALLIVVPVTVGTILVAVFSGELLALFDPSFETAALALSILAASYLVMGLGGPRRQLMLMADGERDVVKLTFISEFIGLALVPVLVPLFGIVGAALAALAARVVFTVTTLIWCRARLTVDASVLSLLRRG